MVITREQDIVNYALELLYLQLSTRDTIFYTNHIVFQEVEFVGIVKKAKRK